MLQPRIRRPMPSAALSIDTLATALNTLTFCPKHLPTSLPLRFSRPASHAAQGRANGPKDSAGRRLGAKKTASQPVVPGNIIYKQRGTKWFPGENCGIGKDHTIYAKTPGYVVYYRDPLLHPKRRFIGVALAKDGPGSTLPTPRNAPTRRRLGMVASPIPVSIPTPSAGNVNANGSEVFAPILRDGYAGNRIANVEIGRAGERSGVKVRPFDRKDRWLAWRKRSKKVQAKIALRAAGGTRKTKGKKSNKKVVLP